MFNFYRKQKKEEGFVILIAVLLSSLFLLLGSAIFMISIRELALSFGAKESQYAFYAADSGIECAVYWDFHSKMATSTHSVEPTGVFCMDQDITQNDNWAWKTSIDGLPTNNNQGGTIFGFDLFPNDSSRSDCVIVSVWKDSDGSTKVESRGYNTCDVNNPRRFERGLRVTY